MINKVIIMGRLTADPELKTTQSGISNCRICVAINRPYQKDKEQEADFINVVAWRQTAEFICRYFSKGKMIIVEGSLRNNNYTDQNGVKHYSMDVQADNVNFGESKSSSGDSGNAISTTAVPPKTVAEALNQEAASIGGLEDFEEILSDGDMPF